MLSKYVLLHFIDFSNIHTLSDLVLLMGVVSGISGIIIFLFLQCKHHYNTWNEFKEFKNDLKDNIYSLECGGNIECVPDEDGNIQIIGNSRHFYFPVIELYNQKYRDKFNQLERNTIDVLNLYILMTNKLGIDIHELKTKEEKIIVASINLVEDYNYNLKHLEESKLKLLKLL